MRRAAAVDANQPDIVKALRKLGASVQHLHQLGQGCPDILIGYKGLNLLAEIKDPHKPLSKRKLTPDEVEWHNNWRGQVVVIETLDDILELLQPC